MTTKELLLPRFKVIADYPGSTREVGSVSTEVATAQYFRKYPHLFKELHWSEERADEDMPEYLKDISNQAVFHVDDQGKATGHPYISFIGSSYNDFLPATEADYLTYHQGTKQ